MAIPETLSSGTSTLSGPQRSVMASENDMKAIVTMLVAMMVFGASATHADLPKGPPAKNMLTAPCQKCA